jgi:flagellar hook-basal body complex protein FliE
MQIPALGNIGKIMQSPADMEAMKGAVPFGGLAGVAEGQRSRGASSVSRAGRDEFSDFLTKAVSEVEEKMRISDVERQKVLTGEANNLHQATIAAQEASVAFSLMVEVRNKLVESYQELMRMQV